MYPLWRQTTWPLPMRTSPGRELRRELRLELCPELRPELRLKLHPKLRRKLRVLRTRSAGIAV